jgi:hypothetical protein
MRGSITVYHQAKIESLRKRCLLFFSILNLGFLLSSCVFYPEVSSSQPYSETCLMKTQKLDLKHISDLPQCIDHFSYFGDEVILVCLVAGGILTPATTFAFSGSMILIGNTLHWLEYLTTCDQDFIRQEIIHHKQLNLAEHPSSNI